MSSQRPREASAEALLDVAVEAAREAAVFIGEHSRRLASLDWRLKGASDFVTEVDTGAEQRIRTCVESRVPGSAVLGEELTPGTSPDAGITFIVDPLDGTTNFLHGYPAYAVSIGAVADGVLTAGAVLDVLHDELFTATRGGGAFRNGARIAVSFIQEPARALVGTGFPFKRLALLSAYQEQFARILSATSGVRRAGSAALDLCAVACGRLDAFWELQLAPWDMAAGMLIVREAGGRVTDSAGRDIAPGHSPVVASNALLHDWIIERIADAPAPPR